jgi:hypothetical protein
VKLIDLYETTDDQVNTASEADQIKFVKNHNAWNAIKLIKHPSEAVQLAAVSREELNLNAIIKFHGIIPSESVQLAAVRRNGYLVGTIPSPSEAVQLAAVNSSPAAITSIKGIPSTTAIKLALTNANFISWEIEYNDTVKELFKDNNLLMQKWLRYGETVRNQQ